MAIAVMERDYFRMDPLGHLHRPFCLCKGRFDPDPISVLQPQFLCRPGIHDDRIVGFHLHEVIVVERAGMGTLHLLEVYKVKRKFAGRLVLGFAIFRKAA